MRFPPCRPGAAAPGRPSSSIVFFVATALAAIGCRCDRLHDIATRSDVNGGSARPARQALSALVRSFAHRLFLPWPFLFRAALDRTSVVSGKSVSVLVALGGLRIIKKKKKTKS